MWICPKCKEQIPDSKNFCAFCEIAKPQPAENYCINPTCIADKDKLNDERKTCRECGELTLIGKTIKDMT